MKPKLIHNYFLGMFLFFSGCTAVVEQPHTSVETNYSPVLTSVVAPPTPFSGADGAMHYVYELQMQNVTPFDFSLKEVRITNGKNKSVIRAYGHDEIANICWQFPERQAVDTLFPQATVFTFIEFSIDADDNGPENLCHEVTIQLPDELPPGFRAFMDLGDEENDLTLTKICTDIDHRRPLTIQPPLKGDGWVAADGCCTSTRHVRAFLPVNGKWVNAQRFAIDWEKIDENRAIFTGDAGQVSNYQCYGEPVFAVADGEVVKVMKGLPDQVPGRLPASIPLAEADGNHIVQHIGNGQFALYAHLKPGSIQVEEGDVLKTGTQIGAVGNTGNSQAPHLHFHITDGPSSLGSNGIPYVFHAFELHGYAVSTAVFDDAELLGIPLEIQYQAPALINNALSLDQAIVSFK